MNRVKGLFGQNKVRKIDNEKKEIDIGKFMTKYFVFAGVWRSEENHTNNSVIGVINLIVLIVGFSSILYMFILRYNDIDINTEILLHTVEIFHTICVQIMFIRKKDDIARLSEVFSITLDQMTLPICTQSKSAAILLNERKSFLKVMKLSFVAIIVVYLGVIYDSNAFGIRGQRKLLYPAWFPFQTDVDYHIGLYYLAIAFELLIYIELLYIDLAIVGIWYGTINAVSGILDILGLTFQMMTDEKSLSQNSEDDKIELQNRMRNCIDLHNFARELVHILNSSVGVIFLEVVLTSEVAICFCGFHVIQALYTKESSRLLKFFIGVGTFSTMLFVYCASGQKLKNKSEEFFESIYFCKWYQQSRSFKKTFYLCQTISKKPLLIDGAQLVPADLHSFVNAMKGVFSFLNFLLAIKEKT